MENSKRFVIMYDFDKTLSKQYMSEYANVKDFGFSESSQFWNYCNIELGKGYDMDTSLAFMLCNLLKAKENGIKLTKSYLKKSGKHIEFFNGVETWFKRINDFGKKYGIKVEHYIISSGLQEIIEGSSISKYFSKVFASSYAYDKNGEAFWPRIVVNYTVKTQYIFRIKKNLIDDITDDRTINKKYSKTNSVIPYENMLYIGDGETDVPCMKLVKEKGGHSVCLYNDTPSSKQIADQILKDERVNILSYADYSEGSLLDKYIKDLIVNVSKINA